MREFIKGLILFAGYALILWPIELWRKLTR